MSSIFGKNTRNRSSIEIIVDMLKVISRGGSKKTHIMYRSNLNTLQLRRYIQYAVAKGLVHEIRGGGNNRNSVRYRLTKKGREFIELYDQMIRIIK